MGTNVLELIGQAAKRQPATSAEILELSSGKSSRSTATRRRSTSSSKSPTKARAKKTSSSGPTKKPCKYGPRGADGYCPKKPRTSSPARQTSGNRTKVTARTGTSATTQAIDVVTNPKASKQQKVAAVEKAVEATATQGLKAGAKKAVKSGPVQKAKAAASRIAQKVPVGGLGGPLVTAAVQVLKAMPSESQLKAATRARQRADAAVKAVERDYARRGQTLPKKQRNILLKQHIDYYLRNP